LDKRLLDVSANISVLIVSVMIFKNKISPS